MKSLRVFFLSLSAISMLAACGEGETERSVPKGQKIERKESRGRLTGDDGLNILGGKEEDDAAKGSPLGVNGFLWRATLDTLSFLPIAAADPFGGTILTDWYEDPSAPGERYKVNAVILDKTLRADGVRISVFKQRLQGAAWRDLPVDDALARRLEDTVLTRARQLRIAQLGR